MIVIIDYEAGNVGSIQNMLRKIGAKSKISSDAIDIEKAGKLILPGVGAYDYGMGKLIDNGLDVLIKKKVLEQKVPILGICLGAQLMGKSSEEGNLAGLALVDMEVCRFKFPESLKDIKIPNMGWNDANLVKGSALFNEMYAEPRFYFVHSYHFVHAVETDILTYSNYGYRFSSAFEKDNIFGVQFHPEKSHKYGMKLLENFVKLT